ncbi:hypothetical protein SFUMM280S_03929 [Streptomyces fumanus]
MNRSPSLLRSTPPSPRTDSVTRMPFTEGGQTMPVGWNCTNSMFSRGAPASSASAWPSPVYSQERHLELIDLDRSSRQRCIVVSSSCTDMGVSSLPVGHGRGGRPGAATFMRL